MSVFTLLSAATATGAGTAKSGIYEGPLDVDSRTFQAWGKTSAGSGAVAVAIEVSNDNANWLTLATISLTLGTSATTDGFSSSAPWAFVRANVTSISGTDAQVTVLMGV